MTPDVEAMEATALLPYDADIENAKRYGRADRIRRTRLEYARDWTHFAHYCEEAGLAILPAAPQTVAAYLASLVSRRDRPLKATSIQRRAAAIAFQHRHHGHTPPTAHPLVADVLAGITREHGEVIPDKECYAYLLDNQDAKEGIATIHLQPYDSPWQDVVTKFSCSKQRAFWRLLPSESLDQRLGEPNASGGSRYELLHQFTE